MISLCNIVHLWLLSRNEVMKKTKIRLSCMVSEDEMRVETLSDMILFDSALANQLGGMHLFAQESRPNCNNNVGAD